MQPEAIRILVVDDDHDVANSLAMLLKMEGYEAKPVYEARAAAASIEEFHPHIVLLDIGLPEMDGYEVARLVRSTCRHQPILVAVSGYGRDEDRRMSREAGFDAHFIKPMELSTLEQLVAERGLKSPGSTETVTPRVPGRG